MSYYGLPAEGNFSSISPDLQGIPTADTAAQGTNTRQLATTAFVVSELSKIFGAAPDMLNTIEELAAALNNDANFATNVLNSLNNKQPLNAGLTSLSGLSTSVDTLPYATSANTFALTPITAAARTLLSGVDSAAQRTALGLNNVNNTSDVNKPVSTAQQAALDLKASLASPTFTGTPLVPTASAATNNTQAASTAFVSTAVNLRASLSGADFTGPVTVPAGATGSQVPRMTDVASAIAASTATAQPLNAKLTAVGGLTYAADTFAYFTGAAAAATTPITAIGRSLLAATTAAAQRAVMGVDAAGTGGGGTATGTNTGDQTITLTGPVTGSGMGTFATTVSPNVITDSNLVQVPTYTIKGRFSAGTGDVQNLTAANIRTIINVADGANNYVHPNHSGDVSSTGDGATVINANTVTLSKMAQVATGTILGRATAGTGNVEAMTVAATKTLLALDNVSNTSDANKPISTATQTALNSKASLGGTEFLTNKTLLGAVITDYTETLNSQSGNSFVINIATGTMQKLATTGNTTITLPASVAGKSFSIIVAYGGAHTITFSGGSTIKWAGGVVPVPTSVAGKFDIYVFIQDGTNTYAQDGGRNF